MRTIAKGFIEEAEKSYKEITGALPERVLEIGAAGGITKLLRPQWITSDVRPGPVVDLVFSGERIEIESDSLDFIFAQDVLHHIENIDLFLGLVITKGISKTRSLIGMKYLGSMWPTNKGSAKIVAVARMKIMTASP